MNESFKPIAIKDVKMDIFKTIDKEWMLITVGNIDDFNTMTASWGTLGTLWHKPVAICFIRPQRYTYKFMENNQQFTLSFFSKEHRKKLSYCGSHSGKDVDKIKETGLSPMATQNENISFEQAKMFFECKKLYYGDIKPENFLLTSIVEDVYQSSDFHRFYIGEVVGIYTKDN